MLNSILSILYAILILFTSQTQSINVTSSVDFTENIFSVNLSDTGYEKLCVSNSSPVIIQTKEQFQDYVSNFSSYSNKQFFEFFESISEEYFAVNALLAVVHHSPVTGLGFDITNVIINDNKTIFEYDYFDGVYGDYVMGDGQSFTLLIAEVKKSDIINTENLVTKATQVYSRDDL